MARRCRLELTKCSYVLALVLVSYVGHHIAPPVDRDEKEAQDAIYTDNTDNMTKEQAQDQEYFRYLTQVVTELEKDPAFKEVLNNATEEDIKTGKIVEYIDLVGHGVRQKLDEVKRMEVEYQRDLLRQKKDHMTGVERNYWNPVHDENKDSFEKDDLKKLLNKHNDMMIEQDSKRREEFKKHEMDKEHKRRESMKNMTEEEKKVADEKFSEHHNKTHEKLHQPGHKAQMEEVWEKEDGLDPDSFDPKTFFNLHDKNSDGYLDQFELETLFLQDLDKVYNESDPETDKAERDEEMERMREHVMKNMDHDKDGLLSLEEFIAETKTDDFEKDEDWKPLTDEDQFSEEELEEYERHLGDDENANFEDHADTGHDVTGDEGPPPPPPV